jgi:hypothetical protein
MHEASPQPTLLDQPGAIAHLADVHHELLAASWCRWLHFGSLHISHPCRMDPWPIGSLPGVVLDPIAAGGGVGITGGAHGRGMDRNGAKLIGPLSPMHKPLRGLKSFCIFRAIEARISHAMAHILRRIGASALLKRKVGNRTLPPLISGEEAMRLREQFYRDGQ